MDEEKLEIIKNWPRPRNVKDLRSFLGLVNYYRRFIDGFSEKAANLYHLTVKSAPWKWNKVENDAFLDLKLALTSAPVLLPPDPEKPFYIFFDASSKVAVGAVLCQMGDDDRLHPVAFTSRKLI